MPDVRPFIVTIQLDRTSFTFFNSLRKKYFPPAINYLEAHLTLFHHLPAGEPSIKDNLVAWSKTQRVLSLAVTEVKSIGKGVAYKIEAPELMSLHKIMQQTWKAWLTPQDGQKLWPHITVQNKVSPAEAKQTLKVLQSSFTPFQASGLGFVLWTYEGGPWQHVESFPFGQH